MVNLNFFVFLDELAHLATFEATLQIYKICKILKFFSETFFTFTSMKSVQK